MRRVEHRQAQETFLNDPQTLLATDAAGEGINLQCAHRMVNYDLPCNPNRLEYNEARWPRLATDAGLHSYPPRRRTRRNPRRRRRTRPRTGRVGGSPSVSSSALPAKVAMKG